MAYQIWKPVVGYEGRYEVSNMGSVRSFVGHRSQINTEREPRILRPHHDKTRSYPSVNLSDGKNKGKGKLKCIHILVAQSFIPNPHNKPWVNHKDGNKLNAKKSNLEWTTPKENQKHAYDTGLKERPIGTKNAMNILSEAQVMEIFNAKKNSYLLAKEFGVTRTCIQGIKNGRMWGHLTGKVLALKGIRKLTDAEVLEIYNSSEIQPLIAKLYRTSQSVVSAIKTGRTHSKLTGAVYKGRKTYEYYGQTVYVGGRPPDSSARAEK